MSGGILDDRWMDGRVDGTLGPCLRDICHMRGLDTQFPRSTGEKRAVERNELRRVI